MKTTDWYDVVWQLGKLSGCHQMPGRSFFIFGKQFPVCARCTGAFVGYIVGALVFSFLKLPVAVDLIFCIIMFYDWLLQRLKIAMSNNIRRFITGTLCGFALVQLYGILLCSCVSAIFKLQ